MTGLIYGMVDGPMPPGRQGTGQTRHGSPVSSCLQDWLALAALALRLEQFERAAVTGCIFG